MTGDKKRILWIDNDSAYIYPFQVALEQEGYEVIVAQTVSEGESLLSNEQFALLILDAMIPVTEDEEANAYPPERTDDTHETGLWFYKTHADVLQRKNVAVIAMTVRIDQGIAEHFASAGLPRERFVRKFDVRDIDAFMARIRAVLGNDRSV